MTNQRSCWLTWPPFFLFTVTTLFIGHAFDLWGTYVAQPNFENEANWIYTFLKPYGFVLTWPLVIATKLVWCVAVSIGLIVFLTHRRKYYPIQAESFREFITHYFYGRSLTWFETTFKLPRFAPVGLFLFAFAAISGPYFIFLGYDNLAVQDDLWRFGGIWLGRYWLDWSGIYWTMAATGIVFWLLWRDFLCSRPLPTDNSDFVKSQATVGPTDRE